MGSILGIIVVIALVIIFPVILFYLFVRSIRVPGTRWWGIVLLLSLLTCYCTTIVGVVGLIAGGNATGSATMEEHYCEEFRTALTQTDDLPAAIARMDAASATDAYQVKEPSKNLRFRYVWLLGGCFLFAGANLLMFGPGRRERRNPADCIVAVIAALVVFLTGIWQIAWGNGYAYQASAYRKMLTEWHAKLRPDAIHASNAEIAAILTEKGVRGLNGLWAAFLELSGEKVPGLPGGNNNTQGGNSSAQGGSGVAIIGGADGPTAVFVGTRLAGQALGTAAPAGKTTTEEDTAEEATSE